MLIGKQSVGSSVEGSRQVQFGSMQVQDESGSSSKSSESEESDDFIDDNVNERLRHQTQASEIHIYTKAMSKVMSSICAFTLQLCHQEIVILREVNNIPEANINLDYIPSYEKYNNADHDIEFIIQAENDDYLTYKKFKKDISWLDKVLKTAILNLQRNFYYDDLIKILEDEEMTKNEEMMLLSAKKFNQNELSKLKQYKEAERNELMHKLQKTTEHLGNAKDELNDRMIENHVKIRYLLGWEKSRRDQNTQVLQSKEREFMETAYKTNEDIENEDDVHEDMLEFLEGSLEEYKEQIEVWMEKYDRDLEEREQAVQQMRIALEEQKDTHQAMLDKYNTRIEEMENYKEHKLELQREAEELERRTDAANIIQIWWRGVMKARHLGPYRKKKKKGKRGGSVERSGRNKK